MNGFKKPFFITVSLLIGLVTLIYNQLEKRLDAQASEINTLRDVVSSINEKLGRIDERTQWLDRLK